MYHVAPSDHTGDLASLYSQHGDAAYDMYAKRWPDAGDLAQYHAHYVHLYDSLADAHMHASVHGGKIYRVLPDDLLVVERDALEFDHPMVRNGIPVEWLEEI